jgi:hypothetical protein
MIPGTKKRAITKIRGMHSHIHFVCTVRYFIHTTGSIPDTLNTNNVLTGNNVVVRTGVDRPHSTTSSVL